jgi:hypothetical protein
MMCNVTLIELSRQPSKPIATLGLKAWQRIRVSIVAFTCCRKKTRLNTSLYSYTFTFIDAASATRANCGTTLSAKHAFCISGRSALASG